MKATTIHLFLALLCIGNFTLLSAAHAENDGKLQQVLQGGGGGGGGEGEIVPGNAKLRYCWKGEEVVDGVGIEYVDLKPYPPIPGQNLTITASGFVRKPIHEGSYINVVVKMGWVTLIKQTFDLCEQSDVQLNMKCPIPKGPVEIVKEVFIPPVIPPGKVKVMADALDVDEAPITCLVGEIQFH